MRGTELGGWEAAAVVETSSARAQLADHLTERLGELIDRAVLEIQKRIPAYGGADPRLSEDLREHVEVMYTTSIAVYAEGRTATIDDLAFTRAPSRRRASQVSLVEFMQAFRVGELVLWKAVCELAGDERMRGAALSFATHTIESGGLASSTSAAIYNETQRALAATKERIRRDLIENLLNGTVPKPGPQLEAARAVGLADGDRYAVVVARPSGEGPRAQDLRVASVALAKAASARAQVLMAVRHGEMVIVLPMGEDDDEPLSSRLTEAQALQADAGTPLAVGISTVHAGLASVPDAYQEACEALERAAGGGVVALSSLSAFEYLTSRGDRTARRLIPASIASFLDQDRLAQGVLTETLQHYLAAGLNAAAAAKELHVHVNTVRYRLSRIAEATGSDPRSASDLVDLLVAVRLS